MDRRLADFLIRAGILLGLSMVLVFGFWEHRNFYQFGLPLLLLGGGLVTFLVILAFRLAMSPNLPRRRPVGELVFSIGEADRILRRIATLVIRPAGGNGFPTVGANVRAKYESGGEFARFHVNDAMRVYLSEITEEDARGAGYKSVADLRAALGALPADGLVDVLQFELLGGRT
ncbi:MAG TPA: hypothetical protein VIB49_02430 [Thermoplasmata archaeon]|jgi:hypothetical protein